MRSLSNTEGHCCLGNFHLRNTACERLDRTVKAEWGQDPSYLNGANRDVSASASYWHLTMELYLANLLSC